MFWFVFEYDLRRSGTGKIYAASGSCYIRSLNDNGVLITTITPKLIFLILRRVFSW
jgi:hypothetical protein